MGRIILLLITVCAVFVLSFFCVEESPKTKNNGKYASGFCSGVSDGDSVRVEAAESVTKIELKDGGLSKITGGGAAATAAGITIEGAGKYVLSGELSDGQIYAEAEGPLEIIFDNVRVRSGKGAALTVMGPNAKIVLADGSRNELHDADEYGGGEFTSGCLFAENSLIITGTGALYVNGNYADGISCGETLRIESGDIRVNAVRTALKGAGAIVLEGGNVTFG